MCPAGADGEEGVAAADDGLIGVVGVEVEAAAAEDPGEDVSGSGDALTGGSSDTDAEGLCHGRLSDLRAGFEMARAREISNAGIVLSGVVKWQVGGGGRGVWKLVANGEERLSICVDWGERK